MYVLPYICFFRHVSDRLTASQGSPQQHSDSEKPRDKRHKVDAAKLQDIQNLDVIISFLSSRISVFPALNLFFFSCQAPHDTGKLFTQADLCIFALHALVYHVINFLMLA